MSSAPTLIAATVFLAAGLPAQATYYVDALNGKDSQSGLSRAKAFKSVSRAANIVSDDEIVIVMPGTYSPSTTGERYPIRLGGRSQNRIRIIGEAGPRVTILDWRQSVRFRTQLIRFQAMVTGAELTGFTFSHSGGNYDGFSACIQCGSLGAASTCRNIDVHGCVFRGVARALVMYGNLANPSQVSGNKFHDNLIAQTSATAIMVDGPGQNSVYNNTLVRAGGEGILIDCFYTGGKSRATIANNIVYGGSSGGITVAPCGQTATFANNNAFGNGVDYHAVAPFSFPKSNTRLDPLFVNAVGDDYHLRPASPMIETGTMAVPVLRHDLDRFSRVHDGNADQSAIIDRGCYEFTRHSMTVRGSWSVGQRITFTVTGPREVGGLLLGGKEGALLLPQLGVALLDPATVSGFVPTFSVPGSIALSIPNNPAFTGVRLVTQGATLVRPGFLNGFTRILQ